MLKLPPVPSPLHLLGGVLAWDALSWGERLSILRVGAAAAAGGSRDAGASSEAPSDSEEPFAIG